MRVFSDLVESYPSQPVVLEWEKNLRSNDQDDEDIQGALEVNKHTQKRYLRIKWAAIDFEKENISHYNLDLLRDDGKRLKAL